MKTKLLFFIFTIFILMLIFHSNKNTKTSKIEFPNITFREASLEHGIEHFFISDFKPLSEDNELRLLNQQISMSGGIAVGDINKDNLPDIFLPGGNASSSKLYLNQGEGKFKDITIQSGITYIPQLNNGATFADINGNGYDDLFIGGVIHLNSISFTKTSPDTFGEVKLKKAPFSLWINSGNLYFEDFTNYSGLNFDHNIFSSSFSDIDKDGDLDAAFTHWNTEKVTAKESIWLNNGKGIFKGINSTTPGAFQNWDSDTWSFTPSFSDINNDGWPDALFVGDFENSQYFLSRIGSWFFNKTSVEVITDENGMGSAIGDYDNDGYLDWFVSSVFDPNKDISNKRQNWGTSGNQLYRNLGNGEFENVSAVAGIQDGGWGWGSCFADFNLDGYLDIFHTNGFILPEPLPTWMKSAKGFIDDTPRLFINNRNGTFSDMASASSLTQDNGRAISCTDFDRDGDIDLLVQQFNDQTLLFLNDASTSTGNNYLGVRLNGNNGNPHAEGARIIIETGKDKQVREIRIGSNYLSQNAAEALFGLGEYSEVDKISIYWDGINQSPPEIILNVKANQWLVLGRSN